MNRKCGCTVSIREGGMIESDAVRHPLPPLPLIELGANAVGCRNLDI
jgi:hypothetical protein